MSGNGTQGEGPSPEELARVAEIGKRVRMMRGYPGLSQAALGEKIGRGHVWVRDVEKGRQATDEGDRYKIANACGLPIELFTVNLQALGEPVSADDLFAALARIEDQIEGGLALLSALASNDTIRKAEEIVRQAHERDRQNDKGQSEGSGH